MEMKKRKLMDKARNWFIHDWEAKLVCLILAFLIWHVIKDQESRLRRYDIPQNLTPRSMKA